MISVVIPVHNEAALLGGCLEAIERAARDARLESEPVEVVVVLDACTDRSAAIAVHHRAQIVSLDAHCVGAARALGASFAMDSGARWIAFTDADTIVPADWLSAQMAAAADAPALISQLAGEGKAAICDQTLKIFVSVYGSETGNCALNFLATGGVFIGGSIAAKIVPRMQDPVFMNSFLDKGRLRSLLSDMPVRIVVNDDSGIIGAARYTLIQKAFKSATRASA